MERYGANSGMELTRFDFKNRVFSVPGVYIFGAGTERKPMLSVELGDLRAALEMESLRREFGIEPESHDYELLQLAENALAHVKYIVPGDQIPTEILDGSASWPIEEDHYETAKNRLSIRLGAWAAKRDFKALNPLEIQELLENPEIQKHVQEGFQMAAEELGLDSRDKVVQMLEQIGREMAYIEALRSYYDWILRIPGHIRTMQALLKEDRQSLESAIRVNQLAAAPIKQYRDMFQNVDAQFLDMASVLRNVPNVIDFIRNVRDDLHRDTLIWAEIEPVWKEMDFEDRRSMRTGLSKLYPFIAQNFMRYGGW